MILLVVDTQKGCFDERLYPFETVRKNIKQLITVARENQIEVVYVQHDDGPGTDLDKSADNYEIYEEFAHIWSSSAFAAYSSGIRITLNFVYGDLPVSASSTDIFAEQPSVSLTW